MMKTVNFYRIVFERWRGDLSLSKILNSMEIGLRDECNSIPGIINDDNPDSSIFFEI